ncbi:ComEC/Rec2 family competence protein [Sphingobium subterraneum]|uniref:ComEC/Rec2 family competence protein n=1 Tax=Sphingobium subterraneum TaxID=627688 RepID=UPI0031B6018E
MHRAVDPDLWASGLESWLEEEREQIGLWLPVALGVGVVAWFALPNQWGWIGWIAVCCGAMLLALILPAGGRIQRGLLAGAVLGAAGCLLIWGKAQWAGERPIARAAYVEMTGRVLSRQLVPAQGMERLIIAPEPLRADLPRRMRINVMDKDHVSGLDRGALIHFRSRLMPPAPPAVPGAYDFARKAYFDGIGATGRALPPVAVIESAPEGASSFRHRLSAHIRAQLAGGSGAIAATLATGDTGAIPEADAEAMRRSGLAHLLSISGLHVSAMIGAVILLVYRTLALSRRLALNLPLMAIAAGAGALAGVGYTILTGAEVPTIRSCVAALLVLGGLAIGRDSIGLRLVATGALVVLLFWPEALVGPSFQMSFLAVTVLVALSEARWYRALTGARDEGWARKFLRSVGALFITGLAIECALMPVALYHFHQAGLLGAFANLIAIPLTTAIIMPAEAGGLLLDTIGLGAPLWWIVGHALDAMLALAHWTAAQPGAVLALPSSARWAFGAVMLGLLWILLWRSRARRWGMVPVVLGSLAILWAPAPDLLVTGDGRHMAVHQPDGSMALLRGKAGDYVRDTLGGAAGEGAGDGQDMAALDSIPGGRCGRDLCSLTVERSGRSWHILATRSRDRLPWAQFVAACAQADIVVSDRRLPRGCTPRWLKLDRASLSESGGVAIYLARGEWTSVRQTGDAHPWVMPVRGYSGGRPRMVARAVP